MARTKSLLQSRPATMLAGALLFVVAVSASASPGAVKRQATATSTGQGFASLTGCHMHGPTQFCMAGPDEYEIVPADATATEEPPSSYTDCHAHGSDTCGTSIPSPSPPSLTLFRYCMNPNGGEVQVIAEGATQTAQETGASATDAAEEEPAGEHCHFHAGVEHCVGAGEPEEESTASEEPEGEHCHFHAGVEHCVGGGQSEGESAGSAEGSSPGRCGRRDREYKIPIRIGMLFVVLVASSIGVFGPILMSTFVTVRSNMFLTILKQFGTGVIISTAFVHLFTHATMMFSNPCLGELLYEATTAAIVMAGLFISFLIEFCVHRAMRWQAAKKAETDSTFLSPKAVEKAEMANISIMEAGIIFHSLLIGITLVVAGDSFFVTLAIVIIFHQLFEGIALGTRIASLGYGQTPLALSHSHSHSHTPPPSVERTGTSTVPLWKKLLLASGFAIVTPIGMAIGIGVLNVFNGNNPSTLIAIGTLDAFSAGILIWVGLVEMWAQDWMLGGELTDAGPLTTTLAMFGLISGMVLMSLLGKWA
ncbi:hypothetical protein F66182_3103 [Fusarium sp. NRRL 66182]|nr:hypothetical protein F66182_3103 [Fusarium sp. NRRL 66182]